MLQSSPNLRNRLHEYLGGAFRDNVASGLRTGRGR